MSHDIRDELVFDGVDERVMLLRLRRLRLGMERTKRKQEPGKRPVFRHER